MSKSNNELMDVQATFTIPFTQVQNSVIDSMSFDNPIDKLVYISLLRFAFNKGEAYPSISTLAMMNCSSENRIRDSIKRLEKIGMVTIVPRTKGNERISNLYKLHDLPESMKGNSILNPEAVEDFKEKERIRKLEKAKKRKKNNGGTSKNEVPKSAKQGTSKNEVPTSNFEVPTSKNEVPTSNFEGEEYLSNKKYLRKSINNNLSIYIKEVQKLEVPTEIKEILKEKRDRLIDDNISLKDIELSYKANKERLNEFQFAEILINTLEFTKKKIGNIKALLKTSIDRYLESDTNKEQSTRKDVVPDWFKDRKNQSSYKPEVDTPTALEIEQQKAELEKMLEERLSRV